MDALDDEKLYEGRARGMLVENLRGCMNFDSGFGSTPGGESHGGQSEFRFSYSLPTSLATFTFFSCNSFHSRTFPKKWTSDTDSIGIKWQT